MYSDPSQIRSVVVPIRLNEAEVELLDAIVRYNGGQKSTLVRELFIEQARLVLAGMADIGSGSGAMEGTHQLQFAAA